MAAVSKAELAIQRTRYQLSRLQTSPQFAAVLDCLFDLEPRRTEPAIAELAVVDERLVVARAYGETSFRHYVGTSDQLAMNLLGFVKHMRLGLTEREYLLGRVEAIPHRPA